MRQVKTGVALKLWARLLDSSGNPVSGVVVGDMVVDYFKGDGTLLGAQNPTSVDAETDATNNPGVYLITLPASAFDTVGHTVITVRNSASPAAVFEEQRVELDVVANNLADVYDKAKTSVDVLTGKWIVDATAKTLTYYDSVDNVVATFDLQDSSGSPTVTQIYRRIPA